MQMGTIKIMEPAKPGWENKPSVISNGILGAVIGAVLACAVAILMYMFDDTVVGERELKRRLNVPVLGEVPSLQVDKKGGKKRGRK